jgi:flavin reductase (DIM6/NTAB) family NADH-FMN oxidoreductase RutF
MSVKNWVPEPLRKRLRPLPEMVPIALDGAQTAVEVVLSSRDSRLDVTRRCVVASLAPFRVAAGFASCAPGDIGASPELGFIDVATGDTLGRLTLQFLASSSLENGEQLAVFDVTGGSHRCLGWPYREWNRWLQERAFRRKPQGALRMTASGVQQTMIFYMCPRPVVLVSVADEAHNNLFPMDLIGALSEDRFSLALRSTSPSIPTMKSTRRVVISDMPAAAAPLIFKLGEHHKKPLQDLRELPFEMRSSPTLGLPYPADALRIRELEILSFQETGSHTFFVTRVASETRFAPGRQLFHVSGSYQYYRSRRAASFAFAS